MKPSPVTLLLTTLALAEMEKVRPPLMVPVTHHKEIVKCSHAKKPPVPGSGKGKPAKGYDPITKTWSKP